MIRFLELVLNDDLSICPGLGSKYVNVEIADI